jgi:hypothetical protein
MDRNLQLANAVAGIIETAHETAAALGHNDSPEGLLAVALGQTLGKLAAQLPDETEIEPFLDICCTMLRSHAHAEIAVHQGVLTLAADHADQATRDAAIYVASSKGRRDAKARRRGKASK